MMFFPERLLPLVDTGNFIIEKKIFQDRSRKLQKYMPSVHVYVVCLEHFWFGFFFFTNRHGLLKMAAIF